MCRFRHDLDSCCPPSLYWDCPPWIKATREMRLACASLHRTPPGCTATSCRPLTGAHCNHWQSELVSALFDASAICYVSGRVSFSLQCSLSVRLWLLVKARCRQPRYLSATLLSSCKISRELGLAIDTTRQGHEFQSSSSRLRSYRMILVLLVSRPLLTEHSTYYVLAPGCFVFKTRSA